MKRALKVVALVVVVLLLGVVAVLAMTFMGRRPLADGQTVSGMTVVADGFSSVAVIPISDGRVALVDAGQDQEAGAIIVELRRRQLGPEAVSMILLTHGHPDHIGGVRRFPKAQVLALDTEVPLIAGEVGARGPLTRLFPASPTGISVGRRLRDGDVVTLGSRTVRVYAVPGHTAGSAAYLVDDVLFVGDSADIDRDGMLQGAPWIFSDSQDENRTSLVRLEQRLVADGARVSAIVPSHSGAAEALAPLTDFARANE